jgi:hypothetical protein
LSDSISRLWSGPGVTGSTGSEETAGDVPWKIPLLTCGPNEAVGVAVEANPAPAAALLARAIPNACVLSFPVVPAPEPPATAKTTPAITTGSDATTIVLRRRRAAGGKSFRGIPSPPMGLFPVR